MPILELIAPRRRRRREGWQLIDGGYKRIVIDGKPMLVRDVLEVTDTEIRYVDLDGTIRVKKRR